MEINSEPALINADPPLHLRQRRLVGQAFSPRRVKLMEPEVRRIASELLEAVESEETMDLVSQFAIPLPMTVIANVLGVPPERQSDFKRWSNAFTRGVGALDLSVDEVGEIFQAVDEFYDYFTEEIDVRRSDPRDDLLTDLVSARVDEGESLTLNEMLQMLVVFLVGGNETTTNLLSWTTHRLLTDPALMAKIRDDMGLLRPLIEEMLRLESPVQGLFRTATESVEIGDVSIPAGSMLWLVYGSGNRDEEALGPADTVDLDRAESRQHLAFGRGEHFCLGANIARLEARVGLELLLSRFPDMRIVRDHKDPVLPSFVLHGLSELPIALSAK
ncbi:cytochrome P450 [Nocardia nova]|uniref:cytochrome P450 n=1 Tax=Nocardia nova TaxID=37330 RepID=UPI00379BBAD6